MRATVRSLLVTLLVLGPTTPAPAAAAGAGEARDTLVLALDGIPFRVVERVRQEGGFEGWPATSALVAPFPSMTNVSFSSMLEPFGVEPAGGYEVLHFDHDRNAVVGRTPFGYTDRLFAWRDAFDVTGRTLGSKLAVYTMPRRKMRHELERIAREVEADRCGLVLAHVGSTDALQHIRGDGATSRLVHDVDAWVETLRREHARRSGRELRVVLLSDHGNTDRKVRGIRGVHRLLRRAGLRVRKHLDRPADVVATTFGVASYGALHLAPEQAEVAALAVVEHPAVELAAWRSAPGEIRLVSDGGSGRVRWRGSAPRREMAYGTLTGDPLRMAGARRRLADAGLLDGEGFAPEDVWFRETWNETYPDALRRLIDALVGSHVENHATVLFSFSEGFAWGWRSAQVSSWLTGGRLEGTHGGLDHDSSLGFFLSTDPHLGDHPALRAEDAFADLVGLWRRAQACRSRPPELDARAQAAQ